MTQIEPETTDIGVSGDIETTLGAASLSDAVDAGLAKTEATFKQLAAKTGFKPDQVVMPELDARRGDHTTVKAMLNLVCNALLFLLAHPEEVEAEWPDDAPPELINQVMKGNPKQVMDARNELWILGYMKTHFVGRRR